MFTLAFKMASVTALTLLILATSACTTSSSGPDNGVTPVGLPEVRKVTRENYMSGREFCKEWGKLTNKEFGLRITVPKNYSDYSQGSIEIYAYTLQEFDPSLPSYLFVDGGPGQNTHGITDVTNGRFNEIRFDQRGLGCSAPESFDTYKDPKLYSTENTVLDMDEIRKAYNISNWTVYGVSYGTLPATQYGSKFGAHTVSVVLEGVVGRPDIVHRWSYKSDKINHVINELSPADRQAFSELMMEQSEDTDLVLNFLFGSAFYVDMGLRQLNTLIKYIIKDGKVQREILQKSREEAKRKEEQKGPTPPQTPGGIDENVMGIIYCRELAFREKGKTTLNYSAEKGFFESAAPGTNNARVCDQLGVKISDERPYNIDEHPVAKNVYYFQGSHDGATLAKGAQQHWKAVPQAKSFFLLAQKGGHNPNLTRLYDTWVPDLQAEQKKLYEKSLNGLDITDSDIAAANIHAKAGQLWRFWTSPLAAEVDFEKELEGIRRIGRL